VAARHVVLALALAARVARADDAPPAGDAPSPKPPGFFKLVVWDFAHVLSAPAHWDAGDWAIFTGVLGATALVGAYDDELDDWARHTNNTWGDVGYALEGLGDGRSFALLGAIGAGGLIFKDDTMKHVFVDGIIASGIAAGFVTPVLATAVGRARPNADEGAYHFTPGHGRSFPSGHVTQVWAVCSVIAASYDSPVIKVLAYGGGAFGSFIRMRRRKHFGSDTLFAAAIGMSIGNTVVHYNRGLRSGTVDTVSGKPRRRVAIAPFVPDGGGVGVAVTLLP
jgi:membrane-associated phospholipid phosphatase